MDGPIMLGVLGGIVLERGGARIPLGGPKAQQLLAVLAANPDRSVPTDRLVDALWPDRPPESHLAVVHSQISRLRTVLGPEMAIRREAYGYRLIVPADAIDSVRFEQLLSRSRSVEPSEAVPLLDAALALWRGPAFGEHAGLDALRADAVRLDELRLVAIDEWATARLERGDAASMVGELEALIEQHPFRERFWVLLMLALARTGRQADALRRAAQLRALLRDETGLDAPQNVRELEARILADDPELDQRFDPDRADEAARHGEALEQPSSPPPFPSPSSKLLGSTSFVGREPDVHKLLNAVREHHLVTVTGPGGVGKTRLAMRAAGLFAGELDGDIAVVELAALRDASGLADVIAHALDIQRRQARSMDDTIEEYLATRSALLLLDNCEHVIDAVASLVDRLRASCPRLKILITSRQPLALAGEYVATLAPLSLPDTGEVSLDAALRSEAVRLFVSRASLSTPGFALSADNVAAVVGICRRLDGLPLGIELAAARLRALGIVALSERLERRVQSLGHQPRRGDPRQRTLTDLMRWSYDLLDPSAQYFFDQLAVFAGGFDLAAAEAVCEVRDLGAVVEPKESLDTLADLVEQSMVDLIDPQVPRYRLLEPLREFAQDRLIERGQVEAVEARHLAWFLQLGESGALGLDTPDEAAWSLALDRDFDNFRAAFRCAVRSGDVDGTSGLVSALREFGFRRVQYEVTSWAQEASELAGADAHPEFPTLLAMRAYGHWVRGDLGASIELAERSVEVQSAASASRTGLAERVLGNTLFFQGRPDAAMVWMDKMLTLARDAGDSARRTHALYMQSIAQTSVGNTVRGAIMAGEVRAAADTVGSPTALAQADYALGLALEGSDPAEALAHLEQSARRGAAAGNRWIEAFALTEVHWLRARRGEHLAGLSGFADVVKTWYRGGDWANQWLSLRRVFGVLTDLGELEEAAVLYGALGAVGAAHALPFEPADAGRLAEIVDDLRSLLGETGFADAVRRGTSMSDTDIVSFVIAHIDSVTAGEALRPTTQ